jgi:hypothetical protein
VKISVKYDYTYFGSIIGSRTAAVEYNLTLNKLLIRQMSLLAVATIFPEFLMKRKFCNRFPTLRYSKFQASVECWGVALCGSWGRILEAEKRD